MDAQKKIEIDNVDYVMTPANAMSSWVALKNAFKLVQGVDLSANSGNDKQAVGMALLTRLLGSLGSEEVRALETIVLKHTSARLLDGTTYRLSEKFDEHFNQHRSHLLRILTEGVIYQFADFFKGGSALLSAMPQLKATPNLN
ncbi:hypothetical protein A4G19_12430 [Pasteurellaceae bacterium Macca]|nr:hypothetical protein [Pasteurellaceae bacterium Macca]MCK3656159.1 hypothetical protein [Pasteurellaceae bacterium Macca]MCK3656247.1 hypothetical protein [Pasteurellaceae bacterium Macca]MCK3656517.1 hypothetical protein [Pasteurellaceae bacterium Macca]